MARLGTILMTGAILGQSAAAQILTPSYSTSTLDRWNYPFNGSPGTRFEMPAFGAIDIPGFDDHDAQVLVGFDTSGDIPPGLGADQYRIVEATLTLTVVNGGSFLYDDSYDSVTTYGAGALDPDPGRPIHVFLTGYRDGFDQSTYTETTAFGFTPVVPPAQGMRRAFAAIFDDTGVAADISNNLKEGVEAVPLAIGTTPSVNPGDTVPADTTFTFDIRPCSPGSDLEMSRMLDLGEVRFSVTNLNPATGGPDGGSGEINYPIFYARENPVAPLLGLAPTLSLRVRVGSPGDFNGDGTRSFPDVSAFLTAFSTGDPLADLNADCANTFVDVGLFVAAFTAP